MHNAEKAKSQFNKGHNCSQSVFSTFAPEFRVSEETALKIACAFGGGMARMGDTCGAVTGALMTIGLKYGRIDPEDEASKEKTYALVQEFVKRFKARHETIVCRELVGYDISIPEEHDKAEEENLFDEICPDFVGSAAEILDEIL